MQPVITHLPIGPAASGPARTVRFSARDIVGRVPSPGVPEIQDESDAINAAIARQLAKHRIFRLMDFAAGVIAGALLFATIQLFLH
jgi:hypothetical protein